MTVEERVKDFWAFYTAHWAMPNLGPKAMQHWVEFIIACDHDRVMKTLDYLRRVKDDDYPPMLGLMRRSYKMFDLRGYTITEEVPVIQCKDCGNTGLVYVVVGRNSANEEWYLISRNSRRGYTETEARDMPCHCPRGVPFNDEIFPCQTFMERMDRSAKLSAGWAACFRSKGHAETFATEQRKEPPAE